MSSRSCARTGSASASPPTPSARARATGSRSSGATPPSTSCRCTSTPTSSRARSRSASPSTTCARSSCSTRAAASARARPSCTRRTPTATSSTCSRRRARACARARPRRRTSATASCRSSALLHRGIELCIGSDSNVRIDPLEELRELDGIARRQSGRRDVFSVDQLLAIGSEGGAAALGARRVAGDGRRREPPATRGRRRLAERACRRLLGRCPPDPRLIKRDQARRTRRRLPSRGDVLDTPRFEDGLAASTRPSEALPDLRSARLPQSRGPLPPSLRRRARWSAPPLPRIRPYRRRRTGWSTHRFDLQ